MIAFGPIPSRRLGRSLGVNNIPPKYCSYSCIYCQVGKAIRMDTRREEYYSPEQILAEVTEKVNAARNQNERIDYISFVPDGEPTLDIHLGATIERLKPLGIPIAIITNGSLLWMDEVRQELEIADWICVKIDALSEKCWKRINAPFKTLDHQTILKGIETFRPLFPGTFTTETMLIDGINDDTVEIEKIASFIARLDPHLAYLAVPTRPPAVKSVRAPGEKQLTEAFQVFATKIGNVELLTGYEVKGFLSTGNIIEDILAIASVHPIHEEGMAEMLMKAGTGWEIVHDLLKSQQLVETIFGGRKFYLRKLK